MYLWCKQCEHVRITIEAVDIHSAVKEAERRFPDCELISVAPNEQT